MLTFTSYGAAGTVTGSCHYVQAGETNLLIDCGMFQGDDAAHNQEPFTFNPASIDYLILTHAHIDHIGRLPKLIKEGFTGKIIATKATLDILPIMLTDCANVLAEEYDKCRRKALRAGEEEKLCEPIFFKEDLALIGTIKKYKAAYTTPIPLSDALEITLYNAGHIMGSAFVLLEYREGEERKRIIFSGDLGGDERLILDPPTLPPDADAIVLESTYGDRTHRDLKGSVEEFKNVITETLEHGGNVIIPSFALERTQEILWMLHRMSDNGVLPPCQVFLDSPLALKATRFYARYPMHLATPLATHALQSGHTPFSFPQLERCSTKKRSIMINRLQEGAIIIAGSGMCNGGRILHHLKHRLWNKKNAVIFVGYQAKGTLGRQIVDGAEQIYIYGDKIKVNASIHTIGGFSAHAGQDDLTEWAKACKGVKQLFLVHGEKEKQQIFRHHLMRQGFNDVKIVQTGEINRF
jgi:metallo-beta-lactamase family protein